ncbi:MAG: AAA family ATPase [Chloroflexota bacterium]
MTFESKNMLLVIRGPSGSGKSTVAQKLFKNAAKPTAIIQQDHYRFIFNPPGGGSKPNSTAIHKMIEQNTLIALANNFNVILEGILTMKSYGESLRRISTAHKGPCRFFYFDISLAETIKRNEQRLNLATFTAEDMTNWYPSAGPTGFEGELTVNEHWDETAVYRFIQRSSGLPTTEEAI